MCLLFMKKFVFTVGKNGNMYKSVVAMFHLSYRKSVVLIFVGNLRYLHTFRAFFFKEK